MVCAPTVNDCATAALVVLIATVTCDERLAPGTVTEASAESSPATPSFETTSDPRAFATCTMFVAPTCKFVPPLFTPRRITLPPPTAGARSKAKSPETLWEKPPIFKFTDAPVAESFKYGPAGRLIVVGVAPTVNVSRTALVPVFTENPNVDEEVSPGAVIVTRPDKLPANPAEVISKSPAPLERLTTPPRSVLALLTLTRTTCSLSAVTWRNKLKFPCSVCPSTPMSAFNAWP